MLCDVIAVLEKAEVEKSSQLHQLYNAKEQKKRSLENFISSSKTSAPCRLLTGQHSQDLK